MPTVPSREAVHRVDKFVVPGASLDEFAALIGRTHEVLQRQEGFVRDLVAEQISGPGEFNIVTLVEWVDQRSYEAAVEAIARFHQEIGFDGRATASRLGVRGDIGIYRERLPG
jgi:hypothetical protein